MREFFGKVGAVLLTLALLGSVGGYLTESLAGTHPKPVRALAAVQTSGPVMETVTVVGHRPTT